MANKYNSALAVLLNNGTEQILPVSKAQLIELAYAQQNGQFGENAKTVEDALTYLLNKGNTDLEAAKTYTGEQINALTATKTAEAGYVLTGITQTNGLLTSYTQTKLDAENIAYNGDSTVQAAIEDIQADLASLTGEGSGSVQDQINSAIEELSYSTAGVDNKPVVAVTQEDGVIAPVQDNINAQYVNVDNTTLEWDIDGDETNDTDITVQSAVEYLQSEINALDNSAARYALVLDDSSNGTNVLHTYKLEQTVNGTNTYVGSVEIPKDQSLVSVFLGTADCNVNPTTGVIDYDTSGTSYSNPQSMNFVHQLADGSYTMTKVDVSRFFTESERGDGLVPTGATLAVKIDETSESFLTVSSNGVKVSGVQDAIDSSINTYIGGLDSEIAEKTENGFTYVMTGVTEADGKLSAATYIGLTDENVKTTFASDDAMKLLAGDNVDVTDVNKSLNVLAGNINNLTIGNIVITDGTYVKASNESKDGTTYSFTIDDSALGNVATLNYTPLEEYTGEVVSILGSNPETTPSEP